MIDLLGFFYEVAKDIKDYLTWEENEKLVDTRWPEKSGLQKMAEADGMTLKWCRADRLASLQLDGYEIFYEIDKSKRVRNKIVLHDGSVLVGRRDYA